MEAMRAGSGGTPKFLAENTDESVAGIVADVSKGGGAALPVGGLSPALVRRYELDCCDGPEHCPQVGSAPGTEGGFELCLRPRPLLHRRLKALFARLGQAEFLGAAVGFIWFDRNQPVPLERQDIAPKRGAVHHHLLGEPVDRQRSLPFQPRKDGELRHAQAGGRQELIIELGYVPSRRSNGEAVAFATRWQGFSSHRSILSAKNVHIRSYRSILDDVNSNEAQPLEA